MSPFICFVSNSKCLDFSPFLLILRLSSPPLISAEGFISVCFNASLVPTHRRSSSQFLDFFLVISYFFCSASSPSWISSLSAEDSSTTENEAFLPVQTSICNINRHFPLIFHGSFFNYDSVFDTHNFRGISMVDKRCAIAMVVRPPSTCPMPPGRVLPIPGPMQKLLRQ